MLTRERRRLQNILSSVSASLAVRQITETGLADLGDYENLSWLNQLELKVYSSADDISVRVKVIVDEERRTLRGAKEQLILCPILAAKIVVQIFNSDGPMMADGIFNTAASGPAHVRFTKLHGVGNSVIEVGIRGIINIAICDPTRAVK
jgi:hypothetical protein